MRQSTQLPLDLVARAQRLAVVEARRTFIAGERASLGSRVVSAVTLAVWLAVGVLVGAATAAEAPSGDRAKVDMTAWRGLVRFANGDMLRGAPESIDMSKGLVWRHPAEAEPMDLRLDRVREVQFGPAATPFVRTDKTCHVQLVNSDLIEGDLVSFDGDRLTLQTWFAGTLVIPRAAVRQIVPAGASFATVYEGPRGLEGWTMGKVTNPAVQGGEWSYRSQAFYATQSASVARDVKLPDLCSIQFDLAWKGTLHMAVALYTDYLQPVNLASKENEPDFGGFYSLQLNNYYANLLPVKQKDPLKYLGTAPIGTFSQKNRAQIEIRVNKPKRLIALLVDGILTKQWIDDDEFAGRGTGIRFVHQGLGQIRLNNILITHWDGQFETGLTNLASSTGPKPTDLLHLRNGDKVSGRLESVLNGTALIALGDAKLPVPMNRIRRVEFPESKAITPEVTPATVKMTFQQNGELRLKLNQWATNAITGQHPILGDLRINSLAIARIQFSESSKP